MLSFFRLSKLTFEIQNSMSANVSLSPIHFPTKLHTLRIPVTQFIYTVVLEHDWTSIFLVKNTDLGSAFFLHTPVEQHADPPKRTYDFDLSDFGSMYVKELALQSWLRSVLKASLERELEGLDPEEPQNHGDWNYFEHQEAYDIRNIVFIRVVK